MNDSCRPGAVSAALDRYGDRADASRAAATLMAKHIRVGLEKRGTTSLVVSGGSTPLECYSLLSRENLQWAAVTVVPSDERLVEPGHPDSNEHMIRSRLLQGPAAAARFLSAYSESDPDAMLERFRGKLLALPGPFCCSLLGMGDDGHFASLFPDLEGLASALDPFGPDAAVLVRTAASPHLRISLTLAKLLMSEQITLLAFGPAKLAVIEMALQRQGNFPVEALLHQKAKPVRIIWAP